MKSKFIILSFFALILFASSAAHADLQQNGILDSVYNYYKDAASNWAVQVTTYASWLFWLLATISTVWTFGMMALRQADLSEFFAEAVRWGMFIGFFFWLLTNGPTFAISIYNSLQQIATKAGNTGTVSASGILDIGFVILGRAIANASAWSPVMSGVALLISFVVLIVLALVALNLLLMLISGWVLAYAGIFFLGFGGAKWTSDIAINYYRVVLSVAAQLYAMILLVGIGKTFLMHDFTAMNPKLNYTDLSVMLVAAVILLELTNKIPPMIAGIITGSSVSGIGNHGTGTALAAGGALAAGVAATGMAAKMAGSAVTSVAGVASAIGAAVSQASENVANGTDATTKLGSFLGFGRGGGGGNAETFAQATNTDSPDTAPATPGDKGGNAPPPATPGDKGGNAPPPAAPGDKGGRDGEGTVAQATNTDSPDTAPATPGDKGGNAPPPTAPGDKGGRDGEGTVSPGDRQTDAKGKGNDDEGGTVSSGQSGGSKLGKLGRIGADTLYTLGAAGVKSAGDAIRGMKDSAMERISQTAGGKMAAAINPDGTLATAADRVKARKDPTFNGNSLSAADKAEVDAFVKRKD